jgi:Leucine-rich repeat (LRR) protein
MQTTILHWSYRDFRQFPDELRSCNKDLEEIYLKENFIPSLPNWMYTEMTNLRFINLAGNLIEKINDQIYLLENLEVLDISKNCLSILPHTIGRLKHLKRLLVNENKLVKLPKGAISKIKCLLND